MELAVSDNMWWTESADRLILKSNRVTISLEAVMAQHAVWRCTDVLKMNRVLQPSKSFVTFCCRNRSLSFNCRQMSSVPRPCPLPSTMSAWQLHEYGSINQLKLSSSVPMPVMCRPHDVLVRVHAASVNPVDVMMVGKWTTCIFGCHLVMLSIDSNIQNFFHDMIVCCGVIRACETCAKILQILLTIFYDSVFRCCWFCLDSACCFWCWTRSH